MKVSLVAQNADSFAEGLFVISNHHNHPFSPSCFGFVNLVFA
jgi:hypothetical protein